MISGRQSLLDLVELARALTGKLLNMVLIVNSANKSHNYLVYEKYKSMTRPAHSKVAKVVFYVYVQIFYVQTLLEFSLVPVSYFLNHYIGPNVLYVFLIRFRELLEELHFLLREVLDRRAEVGFFFFMRTLMLFFA